VEHARELAEKLRAGGLRPFVDASGETVGKKVRAAQLMKVPYTLVIGDREMEGGNLTVRDRSGTEAKDVALDAFVRALTEEAGIRSLQQSRFGD
jgi:threonyl-tRNA synthetase